MSVYRQNGQQVIGPRGEHFADANGPTAAQMIAQAMNATFVVGIALDACQVCSGGGMTGGCTRCGRSSLSRHFGHAGRAAGVCLSERRGR